MTEEKWKPIPGFEDYAASSLGRIRSTARSSYREGIGWVRLSERILKPTVRGDGHLQVDLRRDKKRSPMKVHRAVLLAFEGAPPEGMMACHNNGNPTDNALSNLRWDTAKANAADTLAHGANRNAAKTECLRGHPLHGENLRIYDGRRYCRSCERNRKKVNR